MSTESDRRNFLLGGTALAGGLLANPAAAQGQRPAAAGSGVEDYPRDHAGPGGPLGSPSDRGKLVPGRRSPGLAPVPVETPDLPKLPHKLIDGVKEFHLHAQPVRRELLPGSPMNHWGYNGTMPGPTIEVTIGDRIRIVVHNELPEPTTLHLHGLELPVALDGIPYVTQNPIMPGKTGVYELTLHQTGTYFYHPHFAMQEAIGMVGLLIIHPKIADDPAVDQDFALISQEFVIAPASDTPSTTEMEFNWLTFNGRSGPFGTPLVCRLGNRVRIRIVNFSTADHHPIHMHGHTFWVTGTEGGRIPESAWIPANNVLVAVAQVREFEFIDNNPGDWVMHCHMFHHMMNHMVTGVGPGSREVMGADHSKHEKSEGKGPTPVLAMDPRYKVPGYPQGAGMHGMMSKEHIAMLQANPRTRGMAPQWYMGVDGLFTVVRVLPPDLYEKVISGKGEVMPGASVPGGAFGSGGHEGHGGMKMDPPGKDQKKDPPPKKDEHEGHKKL
jgi:FtsP/CotA-like multicopper oxidase with cupredoxin domain